MWGERRGHAYLLRIPYDGLSPTTPQYEAGNLTDPPVSVPNALSFMMPQENRETSSSNIRTRHIVARRQQQHFLPNSHRQIVVPRLLCVRLLRKD